MSFTPIFIPDAPVQKLDSEFLAQHEISVSILREDLNHPLIMGNKFRKLKYNLIQAQKEGKDTLLTFGGAFSNHIHATAGAGKAFNFKTIGVIRGEELKDKPRNPTLRDAEEMGMQLHFVSREAYRQKETADFISTLKETFGDVYILPEGGTNALAVKGCQEILHSGTHDFNYIACAMGTGGTISGIISSALPHQKVLGFPALKGGDFLQKTIESYTQNRNYEIINAFHFGGYGKFNEDLISFVREFHHTYGIPIEPIYTGKMLYGIWDMIKNGLFPKGSQILVVHTGGLQGIEGINNLLKKKNKQPIEK